jgi:glycosyltransferase involved in cell wall biosynthesis
MLPLVSVIIPNYNHANYLEKRINSVLSQTYSNYEVIILDDNSNDDSELIIEKYRQNSKVAKIVFNTVNSGSPFLQWIKGFEYCKGEFIWVAESDDWADSIFLKKLIEFSLTNNTELTFSRSSFIVGEKNEGIYKWGEIGDINLWEGDFVMSGRDFIKNFMIYRNSIPNASSVIFRNNFKVHESILKHFKFCGDWMFWSTILSQGKIGYCSQVLNFHRFHENTTRSVKNINEEILKLTEYFKCIDYASKLIGEKKSYFNSNYDWILKDVRYKINSNNDLKKLEGILPLCLKYRYFFNKNWLSS